MALCRGYSYNGQTGRDGSLIWNETDLAISTGSAYAAGDALHTGYLTFPCAAGEENYTGFIVSVLVYEDNNGTAAVKPAGTLYLFNKVPTSQTANSAMSLSEADMLAIQAKIPVTAASAALQTNYSWVEQAPPIADELYMTDTNSTYLYGIFEMSTTSNFATGASVKIGIKVLRN